MESETTSSQSQAAGITPAELWALIPVKALKLAKQRLKEYLGSLREGFTLAMFEDVLAAVAASRAVTRVVVVTPDARIADMAKQRGITLVQDGAAVGMNAAIGLGVTAIRGMGGQRVVILPADLPLLTGDELDRLAEAFAQQGGGTDREAIGINPSTDRGGTNCFFLDAGKPFSFHYGTGSFSQHRNSAEAHQRKVIALVSPAESLDIDEPSDIGEFLAFCAHHPQFKETQTWKFLRSCERLGPTVSNLES